MANNTFPLTKPIEVLDPVPNLDYHYGPYVSVEAALAALAEIGKVGRPFAVFKDETKKTVDFFLIGEDANGNKIAVPTGGGNAKFPEAGTDGDLLEKDSTTPEGVKFSNTIPAKITAVENALDTEIVNRAADDLAEKNARIAADLQEKNERIAADALKVDKPTTDGTWSLKKQGAVFSWIAVQAGLDSSGLVDKMLAIWDATAGKLVSSGLKLVTGAINQLEFIGRIKADAFVLPANGNPIVPNRLRSDGNKLWYANDLAQEKEIAYSGSVLSQNFTGSVIDLSKQGGSFQMTANSSTAYTTKDAVIGGWAIVKINAASEPTILNATKIAGFNFLANTNMYLYVRYNGNNVEYFFDLIN